MESRVYVFPFRSISVNDLYGFTGGKGRGRRDRYLRDKTYHKRIYECMEFQDNVLYDGSKITLCDGEYLYFRYFFCFKDSEYYLKGSKTINRIDCSNQVKGLEDGIVRYLGIDDKYNKSLFLTKLNTPTLVPDLQEDFTIVYITKDIEHNFIDNSHNEITSLLRLMQDNFGKS